MRNIFLYLCLVGIAGCSSSTIGKKDVEHERKFRVVVSASPGSIYSGMSYSYFMSCASNSGSKEYRNVKRIDYVRKENLKTGLRLEDSYDIGFNTSIKLIDCDTIGTIQKVSVRVTADYLESMKYKATGDLIKRTPKVAHKRFKGVVSAPINGDRVKLRRVDDGDIYLSVTRY